MRAGKTQAGVEIFSPRSVRIRCRDPGNRPWLNPSACFARLETQVEGGRVANLAAIGFYFAQPLEQLGLDARGEFRGQLDRARGPSQHDAAFESAEVIEEP